MRFILFLFFSLLINISVFADLIKPSPDIRADEVIKIQLKALMNNDIPYLDAGISQTWEFAHPDNRKFTGPLENFSLMMKSVSYQLMLGHLEHNLILVSENDNSSNYFIELTDKNGDLFGFTWVVKKVISTGKLKDCWMTSSVSRPMPLAKTT